MNCGINTADWYCPIIDFIKFSWSYILVAVIFGLYYYFRGLKDGRKEVLK